MDTSRQAYAASGDPGRTYHEPEPTMTFEPLEYSSVPLRSPPPSLTPLGDRSRSNNNNNNNSSNNNTLLSNIRHQRQLSAPNFDFSNAESRSLSPSPSPSPKPARHARHQSQGTMPLTGDGRAAVRRSDTSSSSARYGTWLSPTPSSSSSAADEAATAISISVSPDATPKSSRSSVATTDTTPRSSSATATTPTTRFNFFSSLATRLTSSNGAAAAQTLRELDDEICNMDVEAALYPGAGADRSGDAFSPAAYKNLQARAAGLARRMQDAYRRRAAAAAEHEAEREAQGEETAETEVRIRSFRSQLESMAAKAVEQEHAMQQLVAELQAEKAARREVEGRLAAATAAIARLGRERERERGGEGGGGGGERENELVEGPLITEDLCVDEEEDKRKRWRNSDGTMRSDLSIDTSAGTSVTDGESVEVDSIFSRSRSPTATVATESEIPLPTTPGQQALPPSLSQSSQPSQPQELLAIRSPRASTPSPKPKQLSTFQKLVKGISGGNSNSGGDNAAADGGCGNCRGQDASVAWDTVSLLRDENKSLKHRVAQLEVVVEGALDVVNGIGM
ncbi:hypothetical protein F4811DRAFT_559251 [Daldinia bambusicola]|nr:hypothetical protein F4811DRAFT_559251 [Daldinia bambusicola]